MERYLPILGINQCITFYQSTWFKINVQLYDHDDVFKVNKYCNHKVSWLLLWLSSCKYNKYSLQISENSVSALWGIYAVQISQAFYIYLKIKQKKKTLEQNLILSSYLNKLETFWSRILTYCASFNPAVSL